MVEKQYRKILFSLVWSNDEAPEGNFEGVMTLIP